MSKQDSIWLRSETKEFERRTPLTPLDAKILIEKKHRIHVEESKNRIFKDDEYREVGCKIEPTGSWPEAPLNAYILGLKELPQESVKVKHRHIYFAHVFKNQPDADAILKRFKNGQGTIFDLEYLHDDNGRRVVTFGKWAGFIGTALGLDIFCHQQTSPLETYPSITRSFDSTELTNLLSDKLSLLKDIPRIIIIGAKGKSGQGAIKLIDSLNLQVTEWNTQETKGGGPFNEIVDYNLLINCVLVRGKTPPFLTLKTLELPERRLSVIADVSCDTGNPDSPLPFCDTTTTFKDPTYRLISSTLPLDVMAIDHLPSMLPAESSIDFSRQLLPHLASLLELEELPKIWKNAKAYYDKRI